MTNTVFLTGATGFLGSHIAESLVAGGYTVRCLIRDRARATHLLSLPNVELVEGSMESITTLASALKNVRGVIHCAGAIKARSRKEFDKVNADGTRQLAETVLEHAPNLSRFVLISSSAVMGPSEPNTPHTPDAKPNPTTHYGQSKLLGEERLLELKDSLPITILRPPAIYGPRDPETLQIFQILRWGLAVRLGNGLKQSSWIYGPDCAQASVNALSANVPSGSVYFVEDGHPATMDEMFDAFSYGLGVRTWGRFTLPNAIVKLAAGISEDMAARKKQAVLFNRDKLNEIFMEYHVVDSSSARKDLNWSPTVDLHEGARRAVEWYRANRWL